MQTQLEKSSPNSRLLYAARRLPFAAGRHPPLHRVHQGPSGGDGSYGQARHYPRPRDRRSSGAADRSVCKDWNVVVTAAVELTLHKDSAGLELDKLNSP